MPVEVEYVDGQFYVLNNSDVEWKIGDKQIAKSDRLPFDEFGDKAISANGDTLELKSRFIPLEGTCNFRDLGGLITSNGKQIAYGKVFRADKLSELSDSDLAQLRSMNIKKVIDFRNELEVQDEPDNLDTTMTYIHLPIGDFDPKEFWKILDEVKDDLKKADSLMLSLYKTFPIEHSEKYKSFFNELTVSESPLVFHCTAGKDRTGIGAALLCAALDVPLNTIALDYENSTYYRFDHNKKYLKIMTLRGVDPEVAQSIMGVKAEFIIEIFDELEEQYGSVSNFLEEELGVNDSIRDLLKAKYLIN